MSKQYKILTIEDISNVINEDNFSNFMIDFTDVMVKLVQLKKIHKKETGKYPESCMKELTWVDDNIRGVSELNINGKSIKLKPFNHE